MLSSGLLQLCGCNTSSQRNLLTLFSGLTTIVNYFIENVTLTYKTVYSRED
jgi:hypothetical protein